jgi:hypothetical protein
MEGTEGGVDDIQRVRCLEGFGLGAPGGLDELQPTERCRARLSVRWVIGELGRRLGGVLEPLVGGDGVESNGFGHALADPVEGAHGVTEGDADLDLRVGHRVTDG